MKQAIYQSQIPLLGLRLFRLRCCGRPLSITGHDSLLPSKACDVPRLFVQLTCNRCKRTIELETLLRTTDSFEKPYEVLQELETVKPRASRKSKE